MAGSCESISELSDSIKCGKCLGYLRKCYLLNTDPASRSYVARKHCRPWHWKVRVSFFAIYIHSNEIHNVAALTVYWCIGVSSTCFGPQRSILRSFFLDAVRADYGMSHKYIYRKPTTADTTIHHTSNHPQEHKTAAHRYHPSRLHSLPLSTYIYIYTPWP